MSPRTRDIRRTHRTPDGMALENPSWLSTSQVQPSWNRLVSADDVKCRERRLEHIRRLESSQQNQPVRIQEIAK